MKRTLSPTPWPCQSGRKCLTPCPGCPGEEGEARPDARRGVQADGAPGAANLAAGDLALIRVAATGEGAIELTPERFEAIGASIAARQADIEARYPGLVAATPTRLRLDGAIACVRALFQHAREGGTYRFLIYERLEFGLDAYLPLLDAGMALSNDLEIDPCAPDPLTTTSGCVRDAVADARERFRTADNDTRLAIASAIFEAIAEGRDPAEAIVLPDGAPISRPRMRAFLEACGLAAIETAWRRRGRT